MEPIALFLRVEAMSGVVLLLAAITALVVANSPWAEPFLSFWQTPVGVRIGSFELIHGLKHWINDGLMTLFFFVVGLEIKRELVLGELSEPRAAVLPVAAALGGMAVPAFLYLSLQLNQPGERGWGMVMATDIAFVVGCLALLGSRVPIGLRVFLLSLAIVDDIGAILVIAIGYSSSFNFNALALAALGIGVVVAMSRVGIRSVSMYVVIGSFIWLAFHESGVHATVTGVILGLLTPTRSLVSEQRLDAILQRVGGYLRGDEWRMTKHRRNVLRTVEVAARETVSPVERLETALHPWVSFLIMPLFALANAGVPITLSGLSNTVAVATIVGLVLGKPLGVVTFSWIAVRLRIAVLPQELTWTVISAGSVLAGIGFTMALFLANLALSGALLHAAKLGILSASLLCAVTGLTLLVQLLPPEPARRKQLS